MSRHKATYPGIEVRAEVTKLFADAFSVFPSIATRYVDRLSKARSTGFIALDEWLRVFQDVFADIGPNALFQLGQREVSNPHFSAATRTLEEALRQIDVAYHKSHRKGGSPMFDAVSGKMQEGIGHYAVSRVAHHKRIHIVCDTPYPCPLEHGIVAGITGHFEPRAIVTHDLKSGCRMKGDARCTYTVSW